MTSNARIALFLPSLGGGGAERMMVNLGNAFSRRGLGVDLVLAHAKGPLLEEVEHPVRIFDLRSRRVLFSLPKLVNYLRTESPDVLLSSIDHANIISVWARALARTPTRVVVRVCAPTGIAHESGGDLKSRLMPWLVSFTYQKADAIVAISRGVAKDLARVTGISIDSIRVIQNPVITPSMLRDAEEKLDHPWFIDGAPPVVLGVGRLASEKDFPTLIRAIAIVRKVRPVRLLILGEGDERVRLEELVRRLHLQNDVSLYGFVRNPFKFMKRSAVLVLSSLWEGFGNVLVEAMALGTPVVSTDCPGGPCDILHSGRLGYLTPIGDERQMANAILEAIAETRGRNIEEALSYSVDRVLGEYADAMQLR